MSTVAQPPSDRTAVRRHRERGRYDRETVHAILDEGLVAHVAFVRDGAPVVLPMAYARIDDDLYVHGAAGNDMLRHLAGGAEACVTVTLLDGLVLARSAFHHSMNYRSVVVFGAPERVTDPDELRAACDALVDRLASGRPADVRPPTDEELRRTLVLRLPVREASAKVRTGPPLDEEEDLALAVWAGVVPLRTVRGVAEPDPGLAAGTPAPAYVLA